MLGTKKNEEIFLIFSRKTTLPFISAVLIIYILNVNNHYKLFNYQIKRINDDRILCEFNYRSIEGFFNNIIMNAHFVGKKLPVPGKYLINDRHGIVIVKKENIENLATYNIVRIINKIKTVETGINTFTILQFTSEMFFINPTDEKLLAHTGIFLIDDKNTILCAFSIDGTESTEEIQLIQNYILRISSQPINKGGKP
ncbi:MAG: hypothetical protein SCM96_15780 [Acidobacteriota bacterium]|nr:hypothetical protein [Acidobacteriota bacterium]